MDMVCGKLYEEDTGTLTFIQFNELINTVLYRFYVQHI